MSNPDQTPIDDDDHDLGFAHDLPKMLGRRRLLTLMGGAGLLSLSGLPAVALECAALPWETAGPYPADGTNSRSGQLVNALSQEGIIRQDLRTSFGPLIGEADGVQLDLELTLLDADGCTRLAGHAIYIWHCDAEGRYSLYDITNANYLRGVGVSDVEGKVRFTTIFPGCYDGRWPHIHFEVFKSLEEAISGENAVLTAQMALPQTEAAVVYASDQRYPNGTSNLGRISLASDNVFSDNSDAQIAQQTVRITGTAQTSLQGSLAIPLDFSAERTTNMAPPPGACGPRPGGTSPKTPPAS